MREDEKQKSSDMTDQYIIHQEAGANENIAYDGVREEEVMFRDIASEG
jgi:hypothetical protein